jgi:uncharacterized protein (DUF362 family)
MFHYLISPEATYPAAPFSPDRAYPELAGVIAGTDLANTAYPAVRRLLEELAFDGAHAGSSQWNPLGFLVEGRRRIVVKPNLVLHRVAELQCSTRALGAHASVARPIIDYLLAAARRLRQEVEIVIADTPLQGADFARVCEETGFTELAAHYERAGFPVKLLDLRYEQAVMNDYFLIKERVALAGDPAGSRLVNLGRLSAHYGGDGAGRAKLTIQDYDDRLTNEHHAGETHRYRFSQTILDADLVVNLCKLKTHVKAGVTLAMKNVVGANVSKDYLPHFRSGDPTSGGDEFPRRSRYQAAVRSVRDALNRHGARAIAPAHKHLKRAAYWLDGKRASNGREAVYAGAWHGNDTLWRTIVDINRALLYADRNGAIRDTPQRKVAHFADGIVGMEGNGPLKGTDVAAGLIAYGDDPVEFDAKLAYIMGFQPENVPYIGYWRGDHDSHAIGSFPADLETLGAPRLAFREPNGWKGRLAG